MYPMTRIQWKFCYYAPRRPSKLPFGGTSWEMAIIQWVFIANLIVRGGKYWNHYSYLYHFKMAFKGYKDKY